MRKKAQVASQFNWIFVLIVGGLFIAMFFAMSNKQSQSAEVKVSAIALEGVTTIFESARTGNSLSTTVEVPDLTIEFSCETTNSAFWDDDGVKEYYSDYTVSSLSRRLPAMPTFAPGTLEGSEIYTWTDTWYMPFKVMNFLFLANPKMRFFFYYSDPFPDLQETMNESFSKTMKSHFINEIEEIADYNDDLTIIAYFSSSDVDPGELITYLDGAIDNSYKVVHIIPDRYNPEFGKAIFHYADGTGGGDDHETAYFGLASLFGVIFSPDKEYYECSMGKAAQRLMRIGCVYYQKHQRLYDAYTNDLDCRSAYSSALGTFSTYFGNGFCSTDDNQIRLGDPVDLFDAGSGELYDKEYSFFSSLKADNKDAIIRSCEYLY